MLPISGDFQLVLIKPSHYDDDGYVIQWVRSGIPSNSLACVYALAARRRAAAGARARRRHRHHGHRRNQYPRPHQGHHRAAQAARRLRHGRAGRRAVEPVPARARHRAAAARSRRPGGDRRLPRFRLHRHAAGDAGRSAGRARHGLQPVRRRGGRRPYRQDAAAMPRNGCLQPIYNYMDDLPALESTPTPYLPPDILQAHARPLRAASTPAAAVRSSAHSAPSSTCRAASRAGARPTTSSI